jgi:CIC family chloride channel protein
LMMAGSLGVLESRWIPMGDPALWGMIGMGAMMGGTMRSPFTATLFILELTHDLNALPALLAGCVASQAVTVLMLRRSILTEKVARRGYHIIREYSVDPLHTLRVEEVMDKQVATLPVGMRVQELSQRIARGEPAFVRHHAMPIVDDAGILVGIITRGDLLRTLERNGQENPIVLDAGTKRLIVTYPDELMSEAADKMLRNHIGRLPVVSREDPRKLIGYIGRIAVLEARLQTHHEENVRETGWHSVPHRGFLQR